MAYNDSPDNEFDQEMERILQEHFQAEDSSLRAPNDPWEWLESRLEEPANPSFFSRLLGMMNPMREGRLSPAFAVAAVAVVAVAAAAIVWAVSGDGGQDSTGGLAAVPATVAPAATVTPRAVEVTPSNRRGRHTILTPTKGYRIRLARVKVVQPEADGRHMCEIYFGTAGNLITEPSRAVDILAVPDRGTASTRAYPRDQADKGM